MKKKSFLLFVALTLASTSFIGCHWMGEKTGQATQEVEEGADDFEEGFEEGKKKE